MGPAQGEFEREEAWRFVRRGGVRLYDEQALLVEDLQPIDEEARFVLLGLSAALRVLLVVHALRGEDVIRIISARKATRLETQEYQTRLR
jgi:uncharacterized DUF497 family protein